ncbi:MAG: pyridoxamine 5'-phosphate oxidase family protein [Thermoguttaceae bacterium]
MQSSLRRSDRAIDRAAAVEILDRACYGVVSTVGVDGAAYGVPLNFARDGETLILHCATEGRKLENIKHDARVSFCVVGDAEVLPEKFTMRYQSVIVTGRAELIDDAERKTELLLKLCTKYSAEHADAALAMLAAHLHRTCVVILHIDDISGKAHR